MKKQLLLFLSFVMITALSTVSAQMGSVTIVSIQSPMVPGTSGIIEVTYTSDVPCKFNVQLRQTEKDNLQPDWGPWHGQMFFEDLPIAATPTPFTINYDVPMTDGNNPTSANLGAGLQYTFFLQLMPTAGGDGFAGNSNKMENLVEIAAAPLSVNDNLKNAFTFYPNPVSDVLMVKSNGLQAKSISIIDVMGRTVKSIQNAENLKSIDVSSLKTGLYIINTDTNQQYKFVKK